MKTTVRIFILLCWAFLGWLFCSLWIDRDSVMESNPPSAAASIASVSMPEIISPDIPERLRAATDGLQETCLRLGYLAGIRGATPRQLEDLIRAVRTRNTDEIGRIIIELNPAVRDGAPCATSPGRGCPQEDSK